jgi:SAM-dependent methyltransferase
MEHAGSALYEEFAQVYERESQSKAIYVKYERPVIRELAGDVREKRVLDLGCGPGSHEDWLLRHDAQIVAIDSSAAMIERVRARFPQVEAHCADFAAGLPFLAAQSIDLVMSSLALHYVEDWRPLLRDLHRVLRPGGRIALSTHHPANEAILALTGGNYFQTVRVTDRFPFGGREYEVTYFHRPLEALLAPFIYAGFRLTALREPPFQGQRQFLFLGADR